ncbi:MAG: ribosome-associated translation inhibitor RaiA [Chitinophagales bacterium]|nr:ribosome-associated translation inhibitor RaiA [Chitinophagales bacterium]
MDIIIQSLGFTAGEQLEGYIKEKLTKIDRMDDNIIRARVTLHKGQSATDNHHCDIRLEIPGYDHFVQKASGSFESASLDAIEALQKIIRRTKD